MNQSLYAPWYKGLVCLLVSQLLVSPWSVAQSSSVPGTTNSIFNTPLNLTSADNVIKSEYDQRSYRYLVLKNQLRVLLISDPTTEKSAAALDVSVGANQNPVGRPGLAHLLEHMLFLSSEKYPQAGEYQAFIAQHGGNFHASTAAENTKYAFEIDNEQLDPALDRFAQFFIAPVFSAEHVERERNAIHSEYLAKLKDDGRRESDVYRQLMNPDHPAAAFPAGNLITLADFQDQSVRSDMIDFYQQYYSSHLMSLVVLGRESLDTLEARVRARFDAVPKRDIDLSRDYPPLFNPQDLPASVEIKPQKELRELTFNFPIPNPDQHYQRKPFEYIAYLLGHEGEGSLLSLLKRLGWADSISATTGSRSRNDAVFQFRIQLTPQGVQAHNQIVSLVFHNIEQLQARGLSSWRYGELQQLADMKFRFLEKRAQIQTVSRLAVAMKIYPPKDILRGDYIYATYDERLIKKSLSYLTRENLLLALTAPEVEPYRVSPWYATPFTVRAGVPEVFDLKQGVRKELVLPEKNLFMPRRLVVKSGSMLEAASAQNVAPVRILNSKNIRAWFAQDQQFMQPRALINFRIKSPLVAATADGAAQARLYAALITDTLNESSYPARLAGIDHSISANMRGYDLNIFGYSSRQGLLINKIMEVMQSSKFKEDRFVLVKEKLLRTWRNENKNLPHEVIAKQVPVLQSEPHWSTPQLIAALENKTFEQFSMFVSRQLIDAKIDALFYGNYFRAEALKLAVLVEHELLNRQAGRDVPAMKLLLLPKGSEKPWLYVHHLDHDENIVELLVQAPSTSVEDAAHMLLARHLLQAAFFNELRTEKQLGYRVSSMAAPLLNLENSLFVVQSSSIPEEEIIREIDRFLDQQHDVLVENFAVSQRALIKQLREPVRSLREQGERYWKAITTDNSDFARRPALAEAVARVTPESLEGFYRAIFMDKNRRLWLTSDAVATAENFMLIGDLSAHKQQMQIIEQP